MPWRTLGITMFLSLALSLGVADRRVAAQNKPPADTKAQPRNAADHATEAEDKNQAEVTGMSPKQGVVWPGMTRAGTIVLPNGWSLKPAGRQSRIGDLPVQIAVHPSEPILAILHAGYGEHEVMTVNGSNGRIIGRVTLPASFAGLVWSADGKRLFAGGGFDDRIYRFDHAEGLLSKKTVFEYPDRKAFLAEPDPDEGQTAKKSHACRRDWRSPRTAKRFMWLPPLVTRSAGSMPRPGHFKAKSRSGWAAILMG